MCTGCGNRLQQSEGLGQDFQDFRAYMGTKTTHQIRAESLAAAHKETMDGHVNKNWDLKQIEQKLKVTVLHLSENLAAKKDLVLSLEAQSHQMRITLERSKMEVDRLQRRKHELISTVPQNSSAHHQHTQLASFGGYS